jgi:hypothetical protein
LCELCRVPLCGCVVVVGGFELAAACGAAACGAAHARCGGARVRRESAP